MKNLIYFTFLAIFFFSCGSSGDEFACDEPDCGITQQIKKEFFIHSVFQSTVTSENIARYLWYTEQGFACSYEIVTVFFDLFLNESNLITQVDIKLWLEADGILTEIDVVPLGAGNSSAYSFSSDHDLEKIVEGCFATVRLRMQFDFDNFGTTAQNDNYMESLLLDNSEMTISFGQGED